MPDAPAVEPEAPETPGTPDPSAAPDPGAPASEPSSEGGGSPSDSPDTDWRQRYEDLRPEADRRASILADIEGRNGSERQARALEQYARIELENEEEPAGPSDEDLDDLLRDPTEDVEALRQEIQEERAQREQERFDELERNYIESTVEGLEEKHSVELSDEEYDLVVNYGLAHRDEFDGKPDLDGGFEALRKAQEAARARYTGSKETVVPPLGTEGEPKIDFRDKEARQKLGTEVFEAAEAAQTQ